MMILAIDTGHKTLMLETGHKALALDTGHKALMLGVKVNRTTIMHASQHARDADSHHRDARRTYSRSCIMTRHAQLSITRPNQMMHWNNTELPYLR